jgi:cell division septation protein DedD
MMLGNDGALTGRLVAIVILTAVSGGSFTLGYFVGRTTAPAEVSEVEVMDIEEPALPLVSEEQVTEETTEVAVEEPQMLKTSPPAAPAEPQETKELKVKKRALKKPIHDTYSVQAGTFEERSYAESFAEKLKKRGYGAYIQSSGSLYKVKVGNFENKEDAEALSRKLKEAEGIEGFVIVSPG